MKKVAALGLISLAILGVAFWQTQKQEPIEEVVVKLYYYDPALDQGPGGPECSPQGLVSVDRTILKSENQIKDTLDLLLLSNLTQSEKDRGLTSEFPVQGLKVSNAGLEDGVVAVELLDTEGRANGGSCRVSVLRAQLEATAKQFSSKNIVKILPEDIFQP